MYAYVKTKKERKEKTLMEKYFFYKIYLCSFNIFYVTLVSSFLTGNEFIPFVLILLK